MVLADVLAGDLGEEVGVDLAQVILTPAVGIEELLSAPSPVTEMVAPLPESNRLDLVNQWLGQAVPLDLATLPRVVTLLKSLSADGQVAAGYQIGKRADLLAALYQARDDKAARAMYELLAEIAKRGTGNG